MTVKELRDALKDFEDDVEVVAKRIGVYGVAFVNSTKQDTLIYSGEESPCVVIYADIYRSDTPTPISGEK